MGADLFSAYPDLLGDEAESVLGWSLQDLCLNGPEDRLTRTEHAQPALYALSYALWLSLRRAMSTGPAGAAGHSLGEYTALAASEVIDFTSGLSLVANRGRAMAAAADIAPSGMAALLGADVDTAVTVVAARQEIGGKLQIANINAPGQIVVAGGIEDIEWLSAAGKDLGVRRSIPLKVAGAFHSSFMQPAADELRRVVAEVKFVDGDFPVWSNVTAAPHSAGEIEDLLVKQMTSPVRFTDTLIAMAGAGITMFVHVGPGDVTAGLVRRTLPEVEVVTVSDLDDIPPAVEALGTMGSAEETE